MRSHAALTRYRVSTEIMAALILPPPPENEFLAEAQQSFDQLVKSMLIEFPTLTREQADGIVARDEFFAGRIEKSTD